MNMEQINGLMYSILTILGKTGVSEDDIKPKLPKPFRNNATLRVSKSLYAEQQEDLDKFLKAQHLSKKENNQKYWEISD